jgi:3-dehydroquinate synthase
MSTVQVLLGERSYAIKIQSRCLADLGPELAGELEVERAVVVTTPRVRAAHFATLADGMQRTHIALSQIEVPDGDAAKSLHHASRVYDELIEAAAERGTVIVGLGGGALCDLAGFVASTYLRGVPLVQVPTTLLAQVDASVGGKTGINHRRGKNLIGTFYQPRLVWVDPDVLRTLPARERRCGLAEVVKVAAIWDAEFFTWLEDHIDAVTMLDPDALSEAIRRSVAIKAEIVGLDEREAGLRSLLNFGHTLGHAIENVHGYKRVRHGEAVAMGMVFAARLSETLGLDSVVSQRIERLLRRIGLPTQVPDWSQQRDAYLRAIAVDKKVVREKVGMVVLRELGRAEVMRFAPEDILARTE